MTGSRRNRLCRIFTERRAGGMECRYYVYRN